MKKFTTMFALIICYAQGIYAQNDTLIVFSSTCKHIERLNNKYLTYRDAEIHVKLTKYFINDSVDYEISKLFNAESYCILKNNRNKIIEEGNYNYENLNGNFVAYYKNGQIRKQGNYENGFMIGEWTYYYRNGKVKKNSVEKIH